MTGAARQAVQEAGGRLETIGFEPLTEAPPGAQAAFRVSYRL